MLLFLPSCPWHISEVLRPAFSKLLPTFQLTTVSQDLHQRDERNDLPLGGRTKLSCLKSGDPPSPSCCNWAHLYWVIQECWSQQDLWAGRSRDPIQGSSHPAGMGPASLPLPCSLCLKQTEELGKAQLPNGTWLTLLGPCAVDREKEVFGWENWMIFRSFFEDDSFWSPFPLTARQVGFPEFPTGASEALSGLSIMLPVPSSVLHSEYCQAQHSPKQSTLPDRP